MTKRVADMTEGEQQRCREQERARYAAHAEGQRARNRAKYAANVEKRRDYARSKHRELQATDPEYREKNRKRANAWREANPEQLRERVRSWRDSNPERARVLHATVMNRRRARLQDGCSPGVTPEQWLEIVEYFGGCCAYCLQSGHLLEREHVMPLKRGGRDEPSNVVPACKRCNRSKGASILPLWYASAVNGKRI